MKKLMFAMAIVACAVQAQAAASHIVFRIDLNPSKQENYTALSTKDDETYVFGTSSSEPPAGQSSFGIKKAGCGGTVGQLSDGYSMYIIQGTTYKAVCDTLASSSTSLWGWEKQNAQWLVDESYDGTSDQSNLYYGRDGAGFQKHLSDQFTYYANDKTTTIASQISGSESSAVAVMLYETEDSDAAQYLVAACSSVDSENIWFRGDPIGDGVRSDMTYTTTGWLDFASIPEPTSGLLMLIGMAGLALKRKRA